MTRDQAPIYPLSRFKLTRNVIALTSNRHYGHPGSEGDRVRQLDQELCIYCQVKPAETRDHVIPRCFFPEPLPDNLITVPACNQCNNFYSKHDEYMRMALADDAVGMNPDSIAAPLVEGPIARSLERSDRHKRDLLRSLCQIPAPTRADGTTGVPYGVRIERARAELFFEKVVRGLVYHEFRVLLPHGLKVTLRIDVHDGDPGQLSWLKEHGAKRERLGSGVCTFICAQTQGQPNWTAWIFCFYDCFFVTASTAPSYMVSALERKARIKYQRSQRRRRP